MDQTYGSQTRMGAYAGFFTRLIAWLIDRALIYLVFWLISYAGSFVVESMSRGNEIYGVVMNIVVSLVCLIIYILYFVGGWMLAGQTLGKSLLRLRVVRKDGDKLKFRNAIIRLIGYWISTFLFFMGYWWVIFDKKRQGWHDHLAGTIVVYSETHAERVEIEARLSDHHRTKRQQQLQGNSE